jgi:hypothetical protein
MYLGGEAEDEVKLAEFPRTLDQSKISVHLEFTSRDVLIELLRNIVPRTLKEGKFTVEFSDYGGTPEETGAKDKTE